MPLRRTRALIVDDDVELGTSLSLSLGRVGVRADVATSGEEAVRRVRRGEESDYDVLLLDVEMPGLSGWDVLDDLRSHECTVPVIFVTAHDRLHERLRGLEVADDYIVKPFEPDELLARMKAVLRRTRTVPVLKVFDLTVDLGGHSVERRGRRIDLSPRELAVLTALAEAQGAPVSKESLLAKAWPSQASRPDLTAVEVQIARLRKKVDVERPALIHTVPRRGYRLLAVQPIDFRSAITKTSLRRDDEGRFELHVDASEVVTRCEGAWQGAARFLGFPEDLPESVEGKPFSDLLADAAIRRVFERLFRAVRWECIELVLRFGDSRGRGSGMELTMSTPGSGILVLRGRHEQALPNPVEAADSSRTCRFSGDPLEDGDAGICGRVRAQVERALELDAFFQGAG